MEITDSSHKEPLCECAKDSIHQPVSSGYSAEFHALGSLFFCSSINDSICMSKALIYMIACFLNIYINLSMSFCNYSSHPSNFRKYKNLPSLFTFHNIEKDKYNFKR
ncbi:hypothetical protein KSP39_PZI012983 [Platanthera zijinensis]|uniref:Uncharacterized protein n=1 Tax=Platanthera zijinensis TaxID=2320716 RepID=A0AAP0BCD2_9ASPA